MNTIDDTIGMESRIRKAVATAAPPRSVVNDVMTRIGSTRPDAVRRPRFAHPLITAAAAALSGIAAVAALIFFLSGGAVLTLADVQNAFVQQHWLHVHYDAGQIKDLWTNLQTGESYCTRYDGNILYINDQTNTRLMYWKYSNSIDQDTPTIYAAGQKPPKWTPQNAWQEYVAPLVQQAAATRPADASNAAVISTKDTLNGVSVLRFDCYSTDMTGKRFLIEQLWADPVTHLPMRERTRLQLGERETSGKEWGTGEFDFPAKGPADFYALGVPRDLPVHKQVNVAPDDVKATIDGINHAHDDFLKQYRAVIWTFDSESVNPIDIIWHDGGKVRDNRYFPEQKMQTQAMKNPFDLTAETMLAWTGQLSPVNMQLRDTDREYLWMRLKPDSADKPQVHVTRTHRISLLATQLWVESIQWPTRDWAPDFHPLDKPEDLPAGCVAITSGNDGNFRRDYYIDPGNDYICIKEVDWEKRGNDWVKARQTVLSDLPRINGHIVAGKREWNDYGNPARGISPSTDITKIQLIPLKANEYPAGTFDPATLTTGADVEGY